MMELDPVQVGQFWAKVEKTDGCWLWRGAVSGMGYGTHRTGIRVHAAHRLSYELATGSTIPFPLVIDHVCRNRLCVNPDHLELVTQRENILRGVGATAANAKKTHCLHGHEFTRDNILRLRSGRRECIQCRKNKRKATKAWRSGKHRRRETQAASTDRNYRGDTTR